MPRSSFRKRTAQRRWGWGGRRQGVEPNRRMLRETRRARSWKGNCKKVTQAHRATSCEVGSYTSLRTETRRSLGWKDCWVHCQEPTTWGQQAARSPAGCLRGILETVQGIRGRDTAQFVVCLFKYCSKYSVTIH